jgi:hypothetical protein
LTTCPQDFGTRSSREEDLTIASAISNKSINVKGIKELKTRIAQYEMDKTQASSSSRLILEVIDSSPSGRKAFFFSRTFYSWQHHSDVEDKQLAALVRRFLNENIDGEVVIRNSESAKELYRVFQELSV